MAAIHRLTSRDRESLQAAGRGAEMVSKAIDSALQRGADGRDPMPALRLAGEQAAFLGRSLAALAAVVKIRGEHELAVMLSMSQDWKEARQAAGADPDSKIQKED